MNHRPLHVLGLLVLVALPAAAQVPPEKAVSTLTVSDGLEVALWASEPLFVNPTCFDIDHKGRVWVCESVNYRCKLGNRPLRREEGDRIVVLEDAKGNGVADTATVFYQSPDVLAPLPPPPARAPPAPPGRPRAPASPSATPPTPPPARKRPAPKRPTPPQRSCSAPKRAPTPTPAPPPPSPAPTTASISPSATRG